MGAIGGMRKTRKGMAYCDIVLEDEHVSLLEPRLVDRAHRQLERRDGLPRSGDAPGTQPADDADDLPVAIEEHDVDREPHEKHVHRTGPVDEHPLAGLEAVAAEQATHPAEGALGNLAALAEDDALGGPDARDTMPGPSPA